jgi:hypothetical protein
LWSLVSNAINLHNHLNCICFERTGTWIVSEW